MEVIFEEMMARLTLRVLTVIANDILSDLEGVDDVALLTMILATTIDQWAADHDLPIEELDDAIDTMAEIMKDAHLQIGLPGKRK